MISSRVKYLYISRNVAKLLVEVDPTFADYLQQDVMDPEPPPLGSAVGRLPLGPLP